MSEKILRVLRRIQVHAVTVEYDLHQMIADELSKAGVGYEKECVLGSRCRIDFLCEGGIGIEVKKGKPNSRDVLMQLARYTNFEAVQQVVLVVERNVLNIPEKINEKPIHRVSLTANYGVSL